MFLYLLCAVDRCDFYRVFYRLPATDWFRRNGHFGGLESFYLIASSVFHTPMIAADSNQLQQKKNDRWKDFECHLSVFLQNLSTWFSFHHWIRSSVLIKNDSLLLQSKVHDGSWNLWFNNYPKKNDERNWFHRISGPEVAKRLKKTKQNKRRSRFFRRRRVLLSFGS